MFFQCQTFSKLRTIIGTTQFSGKSHRIQMFRIWGMAIALPVVWFFLYVVARGDVWIWVSGGIGGLIGGAIGIVIERRINRDIDALLSSFTDAADDTDTCPD